MRRDKTLRARAVWRGSSRAEIDIRQHHLTTGEPVAAGGDDGGPTPMEVVLAGFEGCLAVVIEAVATEHGIAVASLEIDSTAVIDVRGLAGVRGVRPYFRTVTSRVRLVLGRRPAAIADVTAEIERRCPGLTLLRAADVFVTLDWDVVAV